jgi:mycoredoxin-dependent peroxiredoxin
MAIEAGREAPDFTLRNPAKEDVTLSSFRGRSNVVLVFFPAAFSGVCTRQLTGIGAHEARYAGEDAQVIGVSVDNPHSLGAFAESLGLRDTILLGDFEPKGEVARRYGVYLPDFGVAGRATFVIDKAGVVRSVALTDNPGQMPDEAEYFAALATCNLSA